MPVSCRWFVACVGAVLVGMGFTQGPAQAAPKPASATQTRLL
jgi:hypothetical protein